MPLIEIHGVPSHEGNVLRNRIFALTKGAAYESFLEVSVPGTDVRNAAGETRTFLRVAAPAKAMRAHFADICLRVTSLKMAIEKQPLADYVVAGACRVFPMPQRLLPRGVEYIDEMDLAQLLLDSAEAHKDEDWVERYADNAHEQLGIDRDDFARRLKAASEARHAYEEEHGAHESPDDGWAMWYAEYMLNNA